MTTRYALDTTTTRALLTAIRNQAAEPELSAADQDLIARYNEHTYNFGVYDDLSMLDDGVEDDLPTLLFLLWQTSLLTGPDAPTFEFRDDGNEAQYSLQFRVTSPTGASLRLTSEWIKWSYLTNRQADNTVDTLMAVLDEILGDLNTVVASHDKYVASLTDGALTSAVSDLANEIPSAATEFASSLTCTEADALARVLIVGGHPDAAAEVLLAHVEADDHGDPHADLLPRTAQDGAIDSQAARAKRYLTALAGGTD